MAEKDFNTELRWRLERIETLGATLAHLSWETPLEGEYLDDIGGMIQTMAIEAKKILSEMDSQAVTPAGLGG